MYTLGLVRRAEAVGGIFPGAGSHRGVGLIGQWIFGILYVFIAAWVMTVVVSHVDRKLAVPWAAPWRMAAPKLFAGAAPLLAFLFFFLAFFRSPGWLLMTVLFTALASPWISAILISVEYLRRRAEDRATGVPRPSPPWT